MAAKSGEDRAYKAGRLKSHGARRESEGSVLPTKARNTTRRREGTLLWSRRLRGKREGMPKTANTPSLKARQLYGSAIGVSQVLPDPAGIGEGRDSRGDDPAKGRFVSGDRQCARHIKKIIVKPYAGKPHVRFERRFMETGRS